MILETVSKVCLNEAKKANLRKASLIRLPSKLRKFSLIKSPHVHKKSREQFEILNYNRILYLEGSQKKLEDIIEKKLINNKHTFFFKIQWQQ
jgi:small subunit ribosomal protein S10